MATVCEKCGKGYEAHEGQAGEICPLKGETDGEKLYNLLNEDLPLDVAAVYMSRAEVAALVSGEVSVINIGYDVGPVYVQIIVDRRGNHRLDVHGFFHVDATLSVASFLQFIRTRLNRWRWQV